MSIHPGDDELLDHALFGDPDVAAHVAACAECRARAELFAEEQRILKKAATPVAAPVKLRPRLAPSSAWKWPAIAAMVLLGFVSAAGAYAFAETQRLRGETAKLREQIRTVPSRVPESAQLVGLRDSFRNVTRGLQESRWEPDPRKSLAQLEIECGVGYEIAELASRMDLTDEQVDRLRRGLTALYRSPADYETKYGTLLRETLTPAQMKEVERMEAEQEEEMREMEIDMLVEEIAEAVDLPPSMQERMRMRIDERLPRRKVAIVAVEFGAGALLDDAKLSAAVRELLSPEKAKAYDAWLAQTRKLMEEWRKEE
jgi:hypothetical protein